MIFTEFKINGQHFPNYAYCFNSKMVIPFKCFSGEIPRNVLEEEEFFINKKKEDIEKETMMLTKDISNIRHLLHNPFEEVCT